MAKLESHISMIKLKMLGYVQLVSHDLGFLLQYRKLADASQANLDGVLGGVRWTL